MTNAPATNAIATGHRLEQRRLDRGSPSASPSSAAGMNAMTRLSDEAARRGVAEHAPAIACMKRARYSHTTASIAPDWIAISNTFAFGPT